jgi:hypothetical protein
VSSSNPGYARPIPGERQLACGKELCWEVSSPLFGYRGLYDVESSRRAEIKRKKKGRKDTLEWGHGH